MFKSCMHIRTHALYTHRCVFHARTAFTVHLIMFSSYSYSHNYDCIRVFIGVMPCMIKIVFLNRRSQLEDREVRACGTLLYV